MITSLMLAVAVATSNPGVVVQKQVIVRQQPTQVLYLVGADVRYSALLRQIIRDELSKAGLQTAKQEPITALSVNCGRCHGGESPKGGMSLSGGLEAAQVTEALRQLSSGAMPPDRQLNRQTKNEIMTELLNQEFEPAKPPETAGEEE